MISQPLLYFGLILNGVPYIAGIPISELVKGLMNIGTMDQYRQLSVFFLIFLTIMCFVNLILISPRESSSSAPRSLTTNNSLIQSTIRPSLRQSYTSKQLMEICNPVKSTNLTNLPFGTIRTFLELRLNKSSRRKQQNKKKNSTK